MARPKKKKAPKKVEKKVRKGKMTKKEREAYHKQIAADYDAIHGEGAYAERISTYDASEEAPAMPSIKIKSRTLYDMQNIRMNFDGRVRTIGSKMSRLHEDIKDRIIGYSNEIRDIEKRMLAELKEELKVYSVWTEYLIHIRGVGPIMAGVLISEIGNILKFRTVSSLWRYSGYGLKETEDGKLEIQRHVIGEQGDFKPRLKSKLHVLAECMIKLGNEKYSKIYYDYKHRIATRVCTMAPEKHRKKNPEAVIDQYGCTKGHRHSMALRYMIKMFLMDLYLAWWRIEGCEPRAPYHEEKLGLVHGEKIA